MRHTYREFVGLGLEQHAHRAEDVPEIIVLERRVRFFAHAIVAEEQLDATAHILHCGEAGLAHHALQHHATRHRDVYLQGFQLVM